MHHLAGNANDRYAFHEMFRRLIQYMEDTIHARLVFLESGDNPIPRVSLEPAHRPRFLHHADTGKGLILYATGPCAHGFTPDRLASLFLSPIEGYRELSFVNQILVQAEEAYAVDLDAPGHDGRCDDEDPMGTVFFLKGGLRPVEIGQIEIEDADNELELRQRMLGIIRERFSRMVIAV